MLEEENRLTSNIATLIVSEADSVVDIVSALDKTQLQIVWQQATTIEDSDRNLAQLDLILYDARSTKITLLETIEVLLTNNLNIPVIVVNGEFNISAAVTAIKIGAIDYIPTDELERLPTAVIKALSEPNSLCLQSQCATQTKQQLEKLIIENPDGIIVVDESGIVQFVNPAALELLGKSSQDLVGESLGFPVVNGDFLEVDIPLSADRILVAQMRVSQIQWQGAKAFVVSLRDISQIKQAEEERVKLLEEARAANKAKDEFLAVLSHELRTPLNPIVGWSQLLVKGNLSEQQITKGAKIIQRNAQLQAQLIEDILDISRIIRGKLQLQASPTNLVTVINNAIETVSLAAQAKSIQIETNLERDLKIVRGDPTRLQQVIWNILSNAVKFTPNGRKVYISLTYGDEQPVSYAHIEIKDTGKGIEPEFLPHVFDYFRQAQSNRSRNEGGLGLGLAIVRRLVELHGGEVVAQSPGLDRGATFRISLPISSDRQSDRERSLHLGSLAGIKILVVDDDYNSKEVLALILKEEDAEVKAVATATEALSIIEQYRPQILLSDIAMPDLNGYELIRQIRELPVGKNLGAIALSGYASKEDYHNSLAAGFDRHLNKPLDVNTLLEVVSQLANG